MILGVICARDEEVTLPAAIRCFKKASVPFIAILDNPTPAVREILKDALDTFETPITQGEHVYRWGEILKLMEWAIKRPHGFDWIWRVDADEVWPDVRSVVELAETEGFNAVNFGICQHIPSVEKLTADQCFECECPPAHKGHPLYLEPHANGYQRVWFLTKQWTFGHGGHSIKRDDNRVLMSDMLFNHYPAIDEESLRKKINRKYPEEEKKRGWHIQYKTMAK